jgi:prepilin-type N-terminal cleavage/methylation domain-containing protein
MSEICRNKQNNENERGFSLLELLIVVLLISIVSVMALLSFRGEKKYLADTKAYDIIDVLHEARQRSLTQHSTMRVEFNQTRNSVRLISEGEPGNAADDKEIKNLKLPDVKNVVVGTLPKNVSKYPEEMSPVPILVYKKSVYPLSQSDTVATLRFLRTGKVLNAGSNAIGDNSAMTGATIYVWMPDMSNTGQVLATGSVIRAITVQGASGLSRYVKCPVVAGKCENWIQ